MRLENIGPEDIVNGNKRLTLGLVWTLIRRFHLRQHEQSDFKSIKDSLLLWCQLKTRDHPGGLSVHNFTTSWQSGATFAALINGLERRTLVKIDPLQTNLQLLDHCFDVAQKELNVPRILDPIDVAQTPDENSILTYISYFYNSFSKRKSCSMATKRLEQAILVSSDVENKRNNLDELTKQYTERIGKQLEWLRHESACSIKDEQSQFQHYLKTERTQLADLRNELELAHHDLLMEQFKGKRNTKLVAQLAQVNHLWEELVKAENQRKTDFNLRLAHHNTLVQLHHKFQHKCTRMEIYINDKLSQLVTMLEQSTLHPTPSLTPESLYDSLVRSVQICDDILSNPHPNLTTLKNLLDELKANNYEECNEDETCYKHIQIKHSHLKGEASKQRQVLEKCLHIWQHAQKVGQLVLDVDQLNCDIDSGVGKANGDQYFQSPQQALFQLDRIKFISMELDSLDAQYLKLQSILANVCDNNNQKLPFFNFQTLHSQLNRINENILAARSKLKSLETINKASLDFDTLMTEFERINVSLREMRSLCEKDNDNLHDLNSLPFIQRSNNVIKLKWKVLEKELAEINKRGFQLVTKHKEVYSDRVSSTLRDVKHNWKTTLSVINEHSRLVNDSIDLLQLITELNEMKMAKPNVDEPKESLRSQVEQLASSEHFQSITNVLSQMEQLDIDYHRNSSNEKSYLIYLRKYSNHSTVNVPPHARLNVALAIDECDNHFVRASSRFARTLVTNIHHVRQLFQATELDQVGGGFMGQILLDQPALHRENILGTVDTAIETTSTNHGDDSLETIDHLYQMAFSTLNDRNDYDFIQSLASRQATLTEDTQNMHELMQLIRDTCKLVHITMNCANNLDAIKNDPTLGTPPLSPSISIESSTDEHYACDNVANVPNMEDRETCKENQNDQEHRQGPQFSPLVEEELPAFFDQNEHVEIE